MAPTSVKEKLHEYIEHADERKIQAIFTLVENELLDRSNLYDEVTMNSFRKTSEGYFAGTIIGYPMEESLSRIKKQIRKNGL